MSTAYTSSPSAQPQTRSSPSAKHSYPPLQNGHSHSHTSQAMDGRQSDYPPTEQPPAAQPYSAQDPRSGNYTATTPAAEYALPSSARSGTFPEYIHQRPHYSPGQGPPPGGMAQPPSPSMPLHSNHANSSTPQNTRSNNDVPIDPSITSPTYPPPQPHYPPAYQTAPDVYGPGHPGVYGRPEWASGQYQQSPMPHYGHPSSSGPPSAGLVSPVNRPGGISTVYSFVPIPGAQQHKRPRRRYEEIERMYKCGWQGCEKAYGTLNHLNAHVTMQSHGVKRTPEEFKEIRKEWKQKKKEEEAQRKADEERQRASEDPVRAAGNPSQAGAYGHGQIPRPVGGPPHLPPLSYTSSSGAQQQAGYGAPSPAMEGMSHYPTSPYGPNNPMYPPQRCE